jgi:hypothetical protein
MLLVFSCFISVFDCQIKNWIVKANNLFLDKLIHNIFTTLDGSGHAFGRAPRRFAPTMELIHRMADGIGVSLPAVMHKAISKAGRKPRGRPVERKACRIPRTNQSDSAKFHIHKVIRVIASRPDKKKSKYGGTVGSI